MAITHTPSSGILAEHIGDKYETPAPEPSSSFAGLKDRIKRHYEICSDYYYSLWGEHIHHGYFLDPADTKEVAQARLIDLLIDRSGLVSESQVLDVGCGIGGTSRYLAKRMGCSVTGVTISGQQVKLAKDLSEKEAGLGEEKRGKPGFTKLGDGRVRFLELDAEKMGDFFNEPATKAKFDCVWISEAMSHLPEKDLFFRNASMLLNPGGKLVVADWFKAEGLTDAQMEADIKPIEDGMLLPGLNTQSEYVKYAEDAGFKVFSEPFDISREVSKTWDISWSLVQNPSLWAFAISQGRDGLAFLQAFRAMRRGYANGTFRYAVMVFQK
ncbi:gamma-tocopherol methyltransferase [Usnea florida]